MPLRDRIVRSCQIAALLCASWAQCEPVPPPFRNPDLPFGRRVDDLVARLTVGEKIGQLMMDTPAIPRLDIPSYHWWNEALHGAARNGVATVFPQAIGLAATWNPALHLRIAEVISTEARAKNNDLFRRQGGGSRIYQGLTFWSPNVNIFRDPRWGRGQETYGEDPFLSGRFAVAFVRGLQGDDPRYLKTVATLKHFAVHSGPEELRHRFDAVISPRDLHETYLPAFEAGVREGGAWSLMSAYNEVDGIPAPANGYLLTETLRNAWGFRGAVVGDVDTVSDIWKPQSHHFAADGAEASALALKAGNDLCSGTTYAALPDALARGLVREADLDRALRRLFLLRFKLGQFDPPERVPYTKIPASENGSPAHDRLALEAARQSLVLLKNDGTLPWDVKTIKILAVIGPTADDPAALVGNYNGTPARLVTLLRGLRDKLEPLGVKVVYEPGVALAAGFRETIRQPPSGVLFTDATRTVAGLKGELFKDDAREGAPIATRTDSPLDLFWNPVHPVPGLSAGAVKARWTGVLVAPDSGDYTLGMTFIGAARLFLDERMIAGEPKPRNPGEIRARSARVRLEAGRAYPVRIEFSQGGTDGKIAFGWCPPGSEERALAAARAADHILLTLGITPALEGEEMQVTAEGFHGGDRTSIQLPRPQRDLLDRVAALRKPFTVVFTEGSAVSFAAEKTNAALFAWYYGQRGGEAVAEALLGEINPGGRLPITFYRSDADLPSFEDYSMARRTYRYFTGRPLYAFGHGLSYTTFAYAGLALSKTTAGPGDTIEVRVDVKNTGSRAGDEVVELYARAVNPPVPMPLQQLVGFQRITLAPGQAGTVRIRVPAQTLRRWDEEHKRFVVDPGDYELRAGPSSDRPALEASFAIRG